MKRRIVFVLKLAAFACILLLVAQQIHKQWGVVKNQPMAMDWRFLPVAVAGFAGVMVSSGLVWWWMSRRMGDRHAVVPLLGAYVFSQIGKYVPGKVVLLLMRLERTGRIGMDPQVCVLSTLLENLFFMISGTLVAGVTAVIFAREDLLQFAHAHPVYLTLAALALIPLAAVIHPRIFYKIVNVGLKKIRRPPMDPQHQLGMGTLTLSVLLFVPCWLFGGLSLWACLRTLGIPGADIVLISLPGTFAASVIGGMAMALTPGGLGTREAIQIGLLQAVMLPKYALTLTVAVGLQRLVQMTAEAILGLAGAGLTGGAKKEAAATTRHVVETQIH